MSGRDVVLVGSGPSAVHFALTALEAGHRVTMLDVGHGPEPPVRPELSFLELKRELEDPAAHFLGDDFAEALLPGDGGEYYGFPPAKRFVFRRPAEDRLRTRGFAALRSFARGGLAEAWTAGVYPFNGHELDPFPFGLPDLLPHYERVAERIGVSGAEDDLVRFLPLHRHIQPPPELDSHGADLLRTYEERRERLAALGCVVGRSRLAVLGGDQGARRGCWRCGRCLWGCPTGALWTPSLARPALEAHPRFSAREGLFVTRFEADAGGRVRAVHARRQGGGDERIPVETLVLAAGTLSTGRIYLASLQHEGGTAPALEGLMDNRQVMLPFVTPRRIGRPWEPQSYQYHQLNMSLDTGDPRAYVHGQVTTLKTALVHPIVQSVPLDLRTALHVFRHVHGALGLVNVSFHDTPRPGNRLELEPGPDGPTLVASYAPPAGEPARVRAALRTYRRALWRLGCVVPPGMTHVRPMGASVHYAGTLPMTRDDRPHSLTPEGRSRVFENLLVVDGSGFPSLPAKNLTFTLMANASRVAEVGLG